MNKKVAIYIQVYNGEKTIKRAIDSVLAQTHRDFVLYIGDNASTDGTRDLIRSYTRKHENIILIEFDISPYQMMFPNLWTATEQIRAQIGCGWWCNLDADDEYKPTFLEEMLKFAERENLDMALCGSEFWNVEQNAVQGLRKVQSDLIISGAEFGTQFTMYHQFMRTMWAKLTRMSVIQAMRNDFMRTPEHWGDTDFTFESLRFCTRVGISSKVLHRYYVNPESGSYVVFHNRIPHDAWLHDMTVGFLNEKVGSISTTNMDFLLAAYMNNTIDTLGVLLKADIPVTEKLNGILEISLREQTKQLAASANFGVPIGQSTALQQRRKEYFTTIMNWLLSLDDVPDEQVEAFCNAGEFVSAAAELADAWVFFKKLRVQFLRSEGRSNEAKMLYMELKELLPNDEEIAQMGKIVSEDTNSTTSYRYGCDDEFYALIERLKDESLEQLITFAANSADKWLEEDHEYYGLLLKWYRDWYHVRAFAQDQVFINYFGSIYNYLKQNVSELAVLYESLSDYRSKMTFKTILQHWLTFHPDLRNQGTETIFEHYFDLDIIKCDENEVFVDCGCFIGDTVQEFIKQYGDRYKSIYSYELTPSTYRMAKENLKGVDRLFLRDCGVSNKNGEFSMVDNIGDGGGNRLTPNGNIMAKVVKIDDDIKEDITFIKMDIEGAELDALKGAEQQIRRNKPKLAISLYHKITDIIEVPKLLKAYVPEYKFYLQHKGAQDFPFPTEYVLLAVT